MRDKRIPQYTRGLDSLAKLGRLWVPRDDYMNEETVWFIPKIFHGFQSENRGKVSHAGSERKNVELLRITTVRANSDIELLQNSRL